MSSSQGTLAEQLAASFLLRQGLKLVETNYRCRLGEIDLILWDRDTLVFAEVRLRKNSRFGGAAASITEQKQLKLQRAAAHYLQHLGKTPPCRFDAVLLDGLGETNLEWIRGAFGAES